MAAKEMYDAKRAAEGKPWRSGFCRIRQPDHDRCAGGYNRLIEPQGWVPCCCDCHTETPGAETSTPAAPGHVTTTGEATAAELENGAGVQPRPVVVLGPTVIPDLDEAVYHGDPVPAEMGHSLSHSGAKKLLSTTPEHFHYERVHGRPTKKAFDFGHAAHYKVLGKGSPIKVIDGNRNATAVKEAIAEAEAAGMTVLKSPEMAKVEAMAKRLHEHPIAGKLLAGDGLDIELSVFWQDVTGVFRRARYDVARFGRGRPVIVDYKSCTDASEAGFTRSVIDWGYYTQDPWYCDGAAALDLADPAELLFAFIAQEKEPPYAVNVHYLSDEFKQIGRQENRRAIELYADCQSSGIWPGNPVEPSLHTPPQWYYTRLEESVR